MKKTITQYFRMLLNLDGKSKSSNKSIPNPQATNNAVTPPSHVYYDAKYFHNDLDNQNDYYLKLCNNGGERVFVRKDEIDDPENIR